MANPNNPTNFDHDQSTVNSPTQQQFFEKTGEGQQTGPETRKGKFSNFMNKFGTNKYVTWGLRALQLIFAIVTLALASRSLNKFYKSESRMRFNVFVSCMTIIYLVVLILVSFFSPSFLVIGAIFLTEVILCIFWLSAFIAVAALYSGFSCTRSTTQYYPYSSSYNDFDYTGSSYISPYASSTKITGCRSAKASSAFAAFSFLLFLLTSLLLWYNVIRVINNRKTLTKAGNTNLDKPCLSFRNSPVVGNNYNTYNPQDDNTTRINDDHTFDNDLGINQNKNSNNNNNINTDNTNLNPNNNIGTANANINPNNNFTTNTDATNYGTSNDEYYGTSNIEKPADIYTRKEIV